MADPEKTPDAGTDDIKADVEAAEMGDADAARRVNIAETVTDASADAAEQEAADGPGARGLSR